MNNFYFITQAATFKTGGDTFYKPPRDKNGFYTMPGFVFDTVSRNGLYYDPPRMLHCLSDTSSRFYRYLTENNLKGELGHPKSKDLERLTTVDEKSAAIFIQKVEAGTIGNLQVCMVTFKPCKPYGDVVEEALCDPYMNCNLSVRVMCDKGPLRPDGSLHVYPKFIVTFDPVGGPGFEKACKRYAVMTESDQNVFGITGSVVPFNINDITTPVAQNILALESADASILKDMLKADSIEIQQTLHAVDKSKMDQLYKFYHNLRK
jgi:hypothetical protein